MRKFGLSMGLLVLFSFLSACSDSSAVETIADCQLLFERLSTAEAMTESTIHPNVKLSFAFSFFYPISDDPMSVYIATENRNEALRASRARHGYDSVTAEYCHRVAEAAAEATMEPGDNDDNRKFFVQRIRELPR